MPVYLSIFGVRDRGAGEATGVVEACWPGGVTVGAGGGPRLSHPMMSSLRGCASVAVAVRLGALGPERYARSMPARRPYPSDLSDVRSELIEPVLAALRFERRGRAVDFGRPPEHDLRDILDAILRTAQACSGATSRSPTGVSPTPSMHVDNNAATCTNGLALDHMDALSPFGQPVPGGTGHGPGRTAVSLSVAGRSAFEGTGTHRAEILEPRSPLGCRLSARYSHSACLRQRQVSSSAVRHGSPPWGESGEDQR